MSRYFFSIVLIVMLWATVALGAININNAGMNELISLPGIGPAKASAIVEYRKAHGPFSSVDDLMKVKGIGPRLLEKLKDLVVIKD